MSSATIIAACGKGGVGKSVFTAACTRMLSQKAARTLAVDADPAMGLSHLLGMGAVPTLGGVRDRLITGAKESKTKEELAEAFEYMLAETLVETASFDFLAMGHSKFKGCFCPVNRLLRDSVEALVENYDVVLVDAEAGLEQVYREVMRHVGYLALLVDCSFRSISTAHELLKSAEELGMECRIGAIVNRFDGGAHPGARLERAGIPLWGTIPEDEELKANDREGRSIFDLSENSPVIESVRKIGQQLWSNKEMRLTWKKEKS
jgi:CO dehydrogenase maturation factor